MSKLTNITVLAYRCRCLLTNIIGCHGVRRAVVDYSSKSNSKLIHTRPPFCTSATPAIDPSATVPPAIPEPYTSENDRHYPQKIHNIVTEISKLTLLEVADLNDLLKKTLNIKDAPVMAMGAVAAVPAEDDEEAAPKKEKTSFTVKLLKFDDTKKVQLIKQIKALVEGMNLVQAKKFVESAPQVVKSDLPKDEAEKLKTLLEEAGGVADMD